MSEDYTYFADGVRKIDLLRGDLGDGNVRFCVALVMKDSNVYFRHYPSLYKAGSVVKELALEHFYRESQELDVESIAEEIGLNFITMDQYLKIRLDKTISVIATLDFSNDSFIGLVQKIEHSKKKEKKRKKALEKAGIPDNVIRLNRWRPL